MTNLRLARSSTGPVVISLAAAAIVFGGCSVKDPAPSDSARAADSVGAPAVAPAPPSSDTDAGIADEDTAAKSVMPPADASGNLTGETTKRGGTLGQDPPRRPERDSAFGPIGTLDSVGTIRPIKK